jgi:hypothetical protein
MQRLGNDALGHVGNAAPAARLQVKVALGVGDVCHRAALLQHLPACHLVLQANAGPVHKVPLLLVQGGVHGGKGRVLLVVVNVLEKGRLVANFPQVLCLKQQAPQVRTSVLGVVVDVSGAQQVQLRSQSWRERCTVEGGLCARRGVKVALQHELRKGGGSAVPCLFWAACALKVGSPSSSSVRE